MPDHLPLHSRAEQPYNQNVIEIHHTILELFEEILNAGNEKKIIEVGIEFLYNQLNLSGASFIPFNELHSIAPPIFYGEVSNPQLFQFENYLRLIEVRQECKHCESLRNNDHCMLVDQQTKFLVRCYYLVIRGRKEGVINVYIPRLSELDQFQTGLIEKVIEVMERGIQRIFGPRESPLEPGDIFREQYHQEFLSKIRGLIQELCGSYQIDQAYTYFPEGLRSKIDKLILLYPSESPELLSSEGIEKFEELFSSEEFSSPTYDLYLGGNIFGSECLVLKQEVGSFPGSGQQTSSYVILFGKKKHLTDALNNKAVRLLFEQIALGLLQEKILLSSLEQTLLDERIRLSREIHDGIAQTMAFLMIQMKRIWRFFSERDEHKFTEVFDDSFQTISDTYDDLRNAIHDLRHGYSTDLLESIRKIGIEFGERTRIKTIVELESIAFNFDPQYQLHFERILQEALSNIRRHANAKNVIISGKKVDGRYRIEIIDDGIGFSNNDNNLTNFRHYGITSMKERAQILSIELIIISIPGEGTRVILIL